MTARSRLTALWRELVGEAPGRRAFRPRIVAPTRAAFRCGNGIPVIPDLGIDEVEAARPV